MEAANCLPSRRQPVKRQIPRPRAPKLFSCLLCALVLLMPNAVQVQAASAQATAVLSLETQIAVQAQTPTVNVSYAGSGEFSVTCDFLVEANTGQVDMFVEVTDFFREDDPTGQVVRPIPLVATAGAEIDPQGATRVGGGGNIASLSGAGDPIDAYPSQRTDTLTFQSEEPSTFNHPVAVSATWNQDEPQKPAGRYVAKMKLTCMAPPP